MKRLFFILILPVQMLLAQEKVTLDLCHQWARENHPALKQKQVFEDLSNLSVENNNTAWLPSLNLNGQATYQSDITKVNIQMPGISIPSVSKDQYKMYLDFSQTIWDGGITKTLNKLEQQKLGSDLQQVEVELYAIQERVNLFYFTQLKLQQNSKVLASKKEILNERLKRMESGVRNGLVLASDLDQLKAEIIKLEQEQFGIESNLNYTRKALAILTGKEATLFAGLENPVETESQTDEIIRPELELFGKQRILLDANADLLQKQRNPKVYGFGQAGYGRPGLNMLSDDFDTYYMVGLGMKWNIHDWKKTRRNQQGIELQKQIIDTKEDQFKRNINLALEQYKQETERLKRIIEQDQSLIGLQENITKTSASKLENGTIAISDYIADLNAETISKLTFETHKIQLLEAIEAIKIIQGKK